MGLLLTGVVIAIVLVAAYYYKYIRETPIDDIRQSTARPNENVPETTDMSDTPITVPIPPPGDVVVEDKGVVENKNDTSKAAVPVSAAVPAPVPAPAPAPVPAPVPAYVVPSAAITEPRIELFALKNYMGKSVTRYAGQSQTFAIMNGSGGIEWKYQSMKITPGTRIILQSVKDSAPPRYQKYAVGKYDVPDMLDFINLYNWYGGDGLFMTHKWWPNRDFKIKVINDTYDDNIIPFIKCTGEKMGIGMKELAASRSCFKKHPNHSLVITA